MGLIDGLHKVLDNCWQNCSWDIQFCCGRARARFGI